MQENLPPDSKVILGVSGGVDSVCLLHLVCQVWPTHLIWVWHGAHGLRETAVYDQHLCQTYAQQWGCHFRTDALPVKTYAQQEKLSIETAARHLRYQTLASLAQEISATAVLVAHHADDQAETVLLNLIRGAGLQGLAGMSAVSPLPVSNAEPVQLLRPLLPFPKTDLLTYAQSHNLTYATDDTNTDQQFTRNRIRHELLPLLESYNPQVQAHLVQTAETAQADLNLLAMIEAEAWQTLQPEMGENWVRWKRDAWQVQPLALRRRMLRAGAKRLGLTEFPFRVLEAARELGERPSANHQLHLPQGLTFYIDHNILMLARGETPIDCPQLYQPQALPVPTVVDLGGGWQLRAEWSEADLPTIQQNKTGWVAYVAVDAPLQIRAGQQGERLHPLGMSGKSAKVRDILSNRKITTACRDHWPLVATEMHPVWLVGQAVDERARVTPSSQKIVKLICGKK